MTTQHFRDSSGNYIGGFGDGATPPQGAIECETPPPDGRAVWTNGAWVMPTIYNPLEPYQFHAMLQIAGLTQTVQTAIDNMADATKKAVANAKLNNAKSFHHDDPLMDTLLPLVGLTQAEFDTYWKQAEEL